MESSFSKPEARYVQVICGILGLKNTTKDFTISTDKLDIILGDIILEGGAIDLQTVDIKAEIPPIVVKKIPLSLMQVRLKW